MYVVFNVKYKAVGLWAAPPNKRHKKSCFPAISGCFASYMSPGRWPVVTDHTSNVIRGHISVNVLHCATVHLSITSDGLSSQHSFDHNKSFNSKNKIWCSFLFSHMVQKLPTEVKVVSTFIWGLVYESMINQLP